VGSEVEADGVDISETVDNLDSEDFDALDVNPDDYVEFLGEDDEVEPGNLPPDEDIIP
jgi:hypothetical protein